MRAIELITDAGTGQLSHTKIWTNIAYAAAIICFIKLNLFSETGAPIEVWYIIIGGFGTHNVVSKLISMKFGGKADASSPPA